MNRINRHNTNDCIGGPFRRLSGATNDLATETSSEMRMDVLIESQIQTSIDTPQDAPTDLQGQTGYWQTHPEPVDRLADPASLALDPSRRHDTGDSGLRLLMMMDAASRGQLDRLQELWHDGIDLDCKDGMDMSLLQHAARNEDLQMIRFLLSKGARACADLPEANVIRKLAAVAGDQELMEKFWSASVDPNCRTKGRSLLEIAVEHRHLDLMKYLLDKGADPDTEDFYECPLKFLAVRNGELEVLRILWQEKANPDLLHEGCTLLTLAASGGHEKVAEFLISQGANASLRNPGGSTALMVACDSGALGVLRLMWQENTDPDDIDDSAMSMLMFAAQGGHAGVVEFLLQHKADHAAINEFGENALMLAAAGGYSLIVDRLAGFGNLETSDMNGQTALLAAASAGHFEALSILLKAGADPGAVDTDGRDALWNAVLGEGRHEDRLSMFERLWTETADVDWADAEGWTLLMLASFRGHAGVAAFLLEKNADLSLAKKNGDTALMLAAAGNFRELVLLLLNRCKKRDLDAVNRYGQSALTRAGLLGHAGVVEILLVAGAKAGRDVTKAGRDEILDMAVADLLLESRHSTSGQPSSPAVRTPLGARIVGNPAGWIDDLLVHIESSRLHPQGKLSSLPLWLLEGDGLCLTVGNVLDRLFTDLPVNLSFLESEAGNTSRQQKRIYCAIMIAGLADQKPDVEVYEGKQISDPRRRRMSRLALAQADQLAALAAQVIRENLSSFVDNLVPRCVGCVGMKLSVMPQLYRDLTNTAGLYGPLARLIVDSLETALSEAKMTPIASLPSPASLGALQNTIEKTLANTLDLLLPRHILEQLDSAAYLRDVYERSNGVPNPEAFHSYLNTQQLIVRNACEKMVALQSSQRSFSMVPQPGMNIDLV